MFFSMNTTVPCFCCSGILLSLYIWLNRANMSSFIVSQFVLKISRHIPSRPGSLLPAPLFTAVFSFSIEIGESSKNLQTFGTVLWPALDSIPVPFCPYQIAIPSELSRSVFGFNFRLILASCFILCHKLL